jgi:hypothetical protein
MVSQVFSRAVRSELVPLTHIPASILPFSFWIYFCMSVTYGTAPLGSSFSKPLNNFCKSDSTPQTFICSSTVHSFSPFTFDIFHLTHDVRDLANVELGSESGHSKAGPSFKTNSFHDRASRRSQISMRSSASSFSWPSRTNRLRDAIARIGGTRNHFQTDPASKRKCVFSRDSSFSSS